MLHMGFHSADLRPGHHQAIVCLRLLRQPLRSQVL